MKTPSLDRFYLKINTSIKLAESYTENKDLSFIIKSCRLKPISLLNSKYNKLQLHRLWIDEHGHSLRIDKKKINIIYNDLSIDTTKIVCTDLYNGLSLNDTIKISKLAFILHEMNDEDSYFISCLGIDNYLRTFLIINNECIKGSGLIIGMKNLKLISKNKDIKYFISLDKKVNKVFPCNSARGWITYLPASKDFITLLDKLDVPVVNYFKEKI
jgi:hypothetical protein